MKITILYRKNLKMSPGKLAAQVGHAVAYVVAAGADPQASIVVLQATDKKFFEATKEPCIIVKDKGLTEVEPGTATCAAFITKDEDD